MRLLLILFLLTGCASYTGQPRKDPKYKGNGGRISHKEPKGRKGMISTPSGIDYHKSYFNKTK